MDRKRKVGFAAIFLSNRYFLNEISVEGKTTSKFYFKIAHYDQYAAQIIRTICQNANQKSSYKCIR